MVVVVWFILSNVATVEAEIVVVILSIRLILFLIIIVFVLRSSMERLLWRCLLWRFGAIWVFRWGLLLIKERPFLNWCD
ncbi:hypothetical protein DER44DRAFT_764842 [Fusarium oxysporum]|nr:hypothetical protein DER44DRAFT_764842 [Fusarium oxysporum]